MLPELALLCIFTTVNAEQNLSSQPNRKVARHLTARIKSQMSSARWLGGKKSIESLKVFSSNGFCHHRQSGKETHANYFIWGQIQNTEMAYKLFP